jgi:hypothetical protein
LKPRKTKIINANTRQQFKLKRLIDTPKKPKIKVARIHEQTTVKNMFGKSTTLNIQPIELQFENQIVAKGKLSIMPLKPRPNAVNQNKIGAHITEIKLAHTYNDWWKV